MAWKHEVDWGLSDTRIAQEIGVSRERVRQVRRSMGYPTSPEIRRKQRASLTAHLKNQDLRNKSIEELAHEYGMPHHTMKNILREAGKSPADGTLKYGHKGKRRRHAWKYDWDNIDWANRTDTDIAKELGIAAAQATMTRKRLGKPKGPDGRYKPNRKARTGLSRCEKKIITALTERGPLRSKELMTATGMHRGSMYAPLTNLINWKYVAAEPIRTNANRYHLIKEA